jgi:hypothetical protein
MIKKTFRIRNNNNNNNNNNRTQKLNYKSKGKSKGKGKGKSKSKSKTETISNLSGYEIKQLLVSLSDNPVEREKLVYSIRANAIVREKLFTHLTKNIHTFKHYTLDKLQTPISQLQELAVPDAWKFQSYINSNIDHGLSNVPIDQFSAQGSTSRSRKAKARSKKA